jgi:hypothetical protein
MVKVRHSKGVAIHTDPESCAGYGREAAREVLTGGRTGEVLSGKSNVVRGADAVVACRRQQARVRHREDLGHPASSLDPEHVRTSLVLCGNREIFVPPWGNRSQGRIGKAGGHSR